MKMCSTIVNTRFPYMATTTRLTRSEAERDEEPVVVSSGWVGMFLAKSRLTHKQTTGRQCTHSPKRPLRPIRS